VRDSEPEEFFKPQLIDQAGAPVEDSDADRASLLHHR
jgi:hypothetical protein